VLDQAHRSAIARRYHTASDMLFLTRAGYPIAPEGALKVKEIAYARRRKGTRPAK
jgi:glucosamine 6-phosphate synthetase-like amidotransferase/phosphosugar isomerase protein